MIAANYIIDLGLKDVGYEYVNSKLATLKCKHESGFADSEVLQSMTAGQ
jgi:hypothetical protein